jgi:centromeric protein E
MNPANKNLEVRESIEGILISRLTEQEVTSAQEVLDIMVKGDEIRNTAETKLNEASSRSHSIFRIKIQSQSKNKSGGKAEGSIKFSQLNLVDLAGSEGAGKTQAGGLRLREGSNINRSLLALSNVINKLSSASGKNNSQQFISYRDSKITRILQPALGGNSKTAIICTMTQTLSNYQETMNTL